MSSINTFTISGKISKKFDYEGISKLSILQENYSERQQKTYKQFITVVGSGNLLRDFKEGDKVCAFGKFSTNLNKKTNVWETQLWVSNINGIDAGDIKKEKEPLVITDKPKQSTIINNDDNDDYNDIEKSGNWD